MWRLYVVIHYLLPSPPGNRVLNKVQTSCSLTFKGWVRLGVDWLPAEPTPEETLDLFNFGDVRVLALVTLVLLAANNQLFSSSIYLLGWIQVSFVTRGVDIISRNTKFEESAYLLTHSHVRIYLF